MNEFEHVHERVLLEEPGARLEFIYRPDVEVLIIQATATDTGEQHVVSIEGLSGFMRTSSVAQWGRVELAGPAATVFWAKIAKRLPREARQPTGGIDDAPADRTPKRVSDDQA